MLDPLTSAAASEVAKAGGGVLSRLLGPTADEMGKQLLEYYQRKNVERVVRRAEAKADTSTDGAIPPRVAAEIFDKAQWASDELVAEYLSGVLASSRSSEGDDDRGLPWTALVGRLSADQLRLHYALYSGFRQLVLEPSYRFAEPDVDEEPSRELVLMQLPLSYHAGWASRAIDVNLDSVAISLAWSRSKDTSSRILHAAYALAREQLLTNVETYDYRRLDTPVADALVKGSISFSATPSGIDLFLYGNGYGGRWLNEIANPGLEFGLSEDSEIPIDPPAAAWHSPPRRVERLPGPRMVRPSEDFIKFVTNPRITANPEKPSTNGRVQPG